MAGGAIAALKSAGVDPSSVPITGGDAEVAALQRILIGEQYAAIYLTIRKEAEMSARLAVAVARGEEPPADLLNAKVDNGAGEVPSILLTLCSGKIAKACREAGIG